MSGHAWAVRPGRLPNGNCSGKIEAHRKTQERVIPGELDGDGWFRLTAPAVRGRLLLASGRAGFTHWPTLCGEAEDLISEMGIDAVAPPPTDD